MQEFFFRVLAQKMATSIEKKIHSIEKMQTMDFFWS